MGLKQRYFYCYSKEMATHIKNYGVESITDAINPSTRGLFSLFLQNEELSSAIESYKQRQNN